MSDGMTEYLRECNEILEAIDTVVTLYFRDEYKAGNAISRIKTLIDNLDGEYSDTRRDLGDTDRGEE